MSPVLKKFEATLHSVISFAERRPWFVMAFFGLVFFAFIVGASKLTQIVSIEDQLDPHMQSTQDLKLSKTLFGGHSSFGFLVMAPDGGFTAKDLCAVKKTIRALERKHSEIIGSMSVFEIRRATVDGNKLYYPSILPDVCLINQESVVSLEVLKDTPWAHLLTGSKMKDLTVNFSLAPLDPPGQFGTFNPDIVSTLLKETREQIPLEIRHTGTSAQEYFTMVGLSEAQWINMIAIILIVAAFRLVFGSWRAGPIYFFTVLLSAGAVYGGMGWFGHAIDPLSVCLFLMLSVASLEDYIFISYDMMKRPESWSESFKRVCVPCFFTSVSAAAAFISLSVSSDLITIKRFGAWASVGAMMEWGAVFVLLPAVLKAFPKLGPWTKLKKARFYEEPERWLKKAPPRSLSLLLLVFFGGAWYSVTHFRLSQTPSEMFPSDHPFQQTINYIREDRGWVADAGLVFDRNVSGEFKSKIREMVSSDPLIHTLEKWDDVVDYVAPAGANGLTREMIEREISTTKLSDRYLSTSGENRDILYLKTTNTAEVNRFREKVTTACPKRECWLAGEFIGFADFSRGLIHTLFESMLGSVFSVGLIVALLGIGTGHLKQAPALVLASFWGPAVMLSAIYLCDISINFVTCIVASTLIGLTGDNAIMFMFQGDSIRSGVEDKGIGSFQTAIIMALCSLTFVFSYFEPPRMLGILLAGGFICALLGDVWLLRGLLPEED